MSSSVATSNTQSLFLDQLRKRLPQNSSLADELSELLTISRDSAYRRIRGETVLSLDEVKKVYDRYGVSVDAIISPASSMVYFQHQALGPEFSLEQWLQSLTQGLEGANRAREKDLILAAKDIPIFHYFRIPELAAFKLFVWSKSIVREPRFAQHQYHPDAIPRETVAAAGRTWALYSKVPTTEIWSEEAINGTIKQLEFYHDCGFFRDRNHPLEICDLLVDLTRQIKTEAAAGIKSEGGLFKLYQNEILIPDNTVLTRIDGEKMVYINYNTLDLLTTQQDPFCEITEAYMGNLVKNSALISATAEKERTKFFSKIEQRINACRSKLV